MSVKENLIAARALIDTPQKWGKGAFQSGSTGCLCALGALGVAANADAYDWNYEDAVALMKAGAIYPAKDGPSESSLAAFNDHPKTTHADIMALFDRAIAAQDAQP